MTAQLDTIPPELLNLVLDELDGETPPSTRLKAFHALSLVSKTLQAAATPFLYKTHHLLNQGKRSTQLVNSVCRNPDLAKYVRCIHFAADQERAERPPTWDDIQVLGIASAPLKALPVYGVIGLALGSGCYTALSLLLVSLSTQLLSLHVDLRQHSVESLVADPVPAMATAVVTPQGSQRCKCCPDVAHCLEAFFKCEQLRNGYKRLTEICPVGKGVDAFAAVLGFMHVPSLQTLACEGFGSALRSYGWRDASVISNVACLKLECGFILVDDLAGILKCCKGLRELDLEWDFGTVYAETWPWPARPPGFNVPSIFAALQPHAMTLERLSMMDGAGDTRTFRSKVDTLQDFHTLRKLAIDAEILIGKGTWASTSLKLPPNLTGLTIHMPGSLEDLPDVCDALARARSETLRDVLLAFPVMDGVNEDWHNASGTLRTGIGRTDDVGEKKWAYGLYHDEEDEDGDHSGLNFRCYGSSLWDGLENMSEVMRTLGVRWLFSREAHWSEVTTSCRYPVMW
ncbi:hypothetical protein LTR85_005363 [Meristemomyces frigidus]|nr:hypothetical protein LTR85_005363 [Meristemomyces frigidus]